MAGKFNTKGTTTVKKARGRSPITTANVEDTVNHAGASAFSRNAVSELFMLGVSNFVGEETFYEGADSRDSRFTALCRTVAVNEGPWFANFVKWLRNDGNMRAAPIQAACEGVHARLQHALKQGELLEDGVTNRSIINSVLQRADEPGELVGYWTARFGQPGEGGRPRAALPTCVKRGLMDACHRLYNEYTAMKYDTKSHPIRFSQVLDLAHPPGKGWKQDHLFRYTMNRRNFPQRGAAKSPDQENISLEGVLQMIWENEVFRNDPAAATLSPHGLKAAGLTWEDTLSALGSKADKKDLWENLIPTMGYMALIRNLRNFDQAGVSKKIMRQVQDRLADPEQVEKSRQFPFRFLSAQKAVESQNWGSALDEALTHSLRNIPELPGRTLVLIDTSASMENPPTSESTINMIEIAAVFGIGIGVKNKGADVFGFASGEFEHPIKRKGASLLRQVQDFTQRVGEVGHGTDIRGALRRQFNDHDRVIILSDQQGHDGGCGTMIPQSVPIYSFTLNGYATTAIGSGKENSLRYELGGVTDATFRMIPLVEAGKDGLWPWEQ